jgi:hypothetical protein
MAAVLHPERRKHARYPSLIMHIGPVSASDLTREFEETKDYMERKKTMVRACVSVHTAHVCTSRDQLK